MTLLNPALWLGLLLAGVPLLLHLLARRRLRRQPFPALDLLKQLQNSRLRKIQLRRWLLLALRTLAILLIAFAFLRPSITSFGSGTGQNATVVLLDLSASMSKRDAGETPLTRAKSALHEIWRQGGEIALVVGDAEGRFDLPFRTAIEGDAGWIDRLAVHGWSDAPTAALRRAFDLLDQRNEAVREVIWISDFANPLSDTLPTIPGNLSLLRVDVGREPDAPNVAVVDARLLEPLPVPGQLAGLEVALGQTGATRPDSLLTVIHVDGERVAEGRMIVPTVGVVKQTFTLRLPSAGLYPASVEIESEDGFLLDNRRSLLINIPPPRHVLIGGDDFTGMRSVELALRARDEGGADIRVTRGELEKADIEWADVIFLVGRARPSSGESQRLASFVEAGGGLWLITGEEADISVWNRKLLPALSLGSMRDLVRYGGRGAIWQISTRQHPVFARLPQDEELMPRLRRTIGVIPSQDARWLVRAGETQPVLLESRLGEGIVWWMPGGVGGDWTDWNLTGLFAPMVQRAAVYLADGEESGAEVVAGAPLRWRNQPEAERAWAVDPLGRTLPVARDAEAGSYRVDATDWPGTVTLMLDGEAAAFGAVNLAARESEFERGWDDTLPGDLLANDGTLVQQLTERRRGREFAGSLLLAALVLLIAESLLGRSLGSKQKESNTA